MEGVGEGEGWGERRMEGKREGLCDETGSVSDEQVAVMSARSRVQGCQGGAESTDVREEQRTGMSVTS